MKNEPGDPSTFSEPNRPPGASGFGGTSKPTSASRPDFRPGDPTAFCNCRLAANWEKVARMGPKSYNTIWDTA